MRRTLAVVISACALFLAVSGCQKKSDTMESESNQNPKMMSADDCTHCAGVQHAKADGTCPQCGMKVK